MDFVVIGAMRAGTTSLQHALDCVDEISLPRMKETNYFIPLLSGDKSEDWYRGLVNQNAARRGEISPNYSKRGVFPGVAEKLYQASPETRIIYVVRDPVQRAISHYQHALTMGWDIAPPETVLSAKMGRDIVNASRYAWQLEPWLEQFGRDRILILDFADLKTSMANTMAIIFEFLDLDASPPDLSELSSNSAAELAKVPSWWLSMRNTGLGVALRSRVPNNLAHKAKRLMGRLEKPVELPEITREFRCALARDLKADAKAFRALSDMPFSDWSV